jgi:hypothetical protein
MEIILLQVTAATQAEREALKSGIFITHIDACSGSLTKHWGLYGNNPASGNLSPLTLPISAHYVDST